MKLSRAEWGILWAATVILALMAGWQLGTGSVRALEQSSAPAAAQTQTPEETPSPTESEAPAGPVDLNTAGLEELLTLPGIGETRAKAILAFREEHGPFQYVEDLIQVPGIGEGILEGLMDQTTVGGTENAENSGG